MGTVLAVLEQRDGTLKKVSYEVLSAARQIAEKTGDVVHAVVLGPPETDVTGLGAYGADNVTLVGDGRLELYQAGLYAGALVESVNAAGSTAILLAATALGKDLAPRIVARLGSALASDVIGLEYDDGIIAVRPVYSGKAIAKVKLSGAAPVVSVRPNAFAPLSDSRAGEVTQVALGEGIVARSETVQVKEPATATLDVAEASVIVSGGRGLKEPENFKLIEDLVAAFGGDAAVGASRAVVDAGWRSHAEQVGQTGKTVSPKLYIAVGISGAIQHIAGMRTAKVIVAINRDKDAPIFKIADYGIVGDLFEVVPKLAEEIAKIKQS